MKKTTELLDTIETNLLKLGSQHKSGQHTLITDALNAIREARQLTNESSGGDKCSAEIHGIKRLGGYSICPDCDLPLYDGP